MDWQALIRIVEVLGLAVICWTAREFLALRTRIVKLEGEAKQITEICREHRTSQSGGLERLGDRLDAFREQQQSEHHDIATDIGKILGKLNSM